MTTAAFFRNYAQLLQAAQHSLDNDLHMPALILIYTRIDSISWASSAKKSGNVQKYFESWLNEYVLPKDSLPCNATDLFAARCGVLHTLTSTADLTKSGKARQLVYSWGPADQMALKKALDLIQRVDVVGIHINELFDAVKEGVARTIEAADSDTVLRTRLNKAAALHFTEMKKETLEYLREAPSSK